MINSIPHVLKSLEKDGENRESDLVAVHTKIYDGDMSSDLALMLILDGGRRMRVKHPNVMRYTGQSRRWWLAYSKLGRGTMHRLASGCRNKSKSLKISHLEGLSSLESPGEALLI